MRNSLYIYIVATQMINLTKHFAIMWGGSLLHVTMVLMIYDAVEYPSSKICKLKT